MKKSKSLFLVLGILFISFNLRAPITAVGSVVKMIQEEYALGSAAAGFITTLPLIAFAIVSPFVSTLANKLGQANTMFTGLILILIGEAIRSYTGVYGLFAGTAIIGIGIAIGNVIVPGIIKRYFSHRAGLITSIYTSGMCIFAAIGAGVSIPLATGLGLGWQNTLCVWFILTSLTIFIWLPQLFILKKRHSDRNIEHDHKSIWTSPLAWWVTLFMGVQSLLFYSLVAWLTTIIISRGLSQSFASSMALLFQLMAIPATLVIPTLCDKFKDQRILSVCVAAIYAIGMILFIFAASPVLMTISVILLSIGMGGSISLSIAFISLRSPNSHTAAELSGMSQSAGYLLAAIGPVVTGFIYDLTLSWTIPIILFIGLIVILAICGMFAGKGFVHHRRHV